MLIRRLGPADAPAYRAIRLEGVAESPAASGNTYEEEAARDFTPLLEPQPGRHVYGAFVEGQLVGIASLAREGHTKTRHRAEVFGVLTSPAARGRGVARRLVEQAIMDARAMGGVRLLTLGVAVGNAPARALYRSLGFMTVGVEPAYMLVDGELLDEERMVLFL